MRVGLGYDVHKLTEGRELILGGVNIPYERGLLGHSDADVLVHAIMAMSDIKEFPAFSCWNMWENFWTSIFM